MLYTVYVPVNRAASGTAYLSIQYNIRNRVSQDIYQHDEVSDLGHEIVPCTYDL